MSRVMIFSRFFPAHHYNYGQETHFVEKILVGVDKYTHVFLCCSNCGWEGSSHAAKNRVQHDMCPKCLGGFLEDSDIELNPIYYQNLDYLPKTTTIRAGERWKVGQKFSPRFWAGAPRRSKQIWIAGDMVITKVQPIEIKAHFNSSDIFRSAIYIRYPETDTVVQEKSLMEAIAERDGLKLHEMISWFDQPKTPIFTGQRIHFEPVKQIT